jgi:carboxyl-terminal processing protease
MRLLPIAMFALSAVVGAQSVPVAPPPGMAGDFDLFCRFVADEYAYFDTKKTQWDKTCAEYRPQAAAATDRAGLIPVLEQAMAELYDAHAHLGTALRNSPRLVPSGSEAWATFAGDDVVIVEVRDDSAAARAGLKAGMRVVSIDDQPVAVAVRERMPRFLREPDPEAKSWALQVALVGRQNGEPVRLAVVQDGKALKIEYVPKLERPAEVVTARRLDEGLAYIRFNNSLGSDLTVKAFDEELDRFKGAKGLILDLRDTPSGGNSQVARGIMSRLVTAGGPYQVHELVAEARDSGIRRRWVEYTMPRGVPFTAPVIVLAGRWTGSMGEGIAIGIHALLGAPVVGTPMARLLGALGETRLPASGIVVRIPTEKLFHVDGTPREAFVPCAAGVPPGTPAGTDPALQTAIALLTTAATATGPGSGRAGSVCPGPVPR